MAPNLFLDVNCPNETKTEKRFIRATIEYLFLFINTIQAFIAFAYILCSLEIQREYSREMQCAEIECEDESVHGRGRLAGNKEESQSESIVL